MGLKIEQAELGISETTHAKSAVAAAVVVGRVHIRRSEEEAVRAGTREGGRRPIVAVVAGTVNRAIIAAVAASTQEIIRSSSNTRCGYTTLCY